MINQKKVKTLTGEDKGPRAEEKWPGLLLTPNDYNQMEIISVFQKLMHFGSPVTWKTYGFHGWHVTFILLCAQQLEQKVFSH